MRHPRTLRRAFLGGEMSPAMDAQGEDPKFQTGARKILNLVCQTDGSLLKRPCFEFLDKKKDSSLRGKLLSFPYAGDEGAILSSSRATVSGRSIGNFRIFRNGEPVLHGPLRDFVPLNAMSEIVGAASTATSPTTLQIGAPVLPVNAYVGHIITSAGSYGIVTSNTTTTFTMAAGWVGGTPAAPGVYSVRGFGYLDNEFYFFTNHALQTGDPVRMLMVPAEPVTFSTLTSRCVFAQQGAEILRFGTPVIFDGVAMPAPLVAYKIYYVCSDVTSTGFSVSEDRFGPPITITTTGTTVKMAAMPEVSTTASPADRLFRLDATGYAPVVTLYAINVSAKVISLAASRSDAMAGTALFFTGVGAGNINIHLAYERGNMVWDPIGSKFYYCMKRPYGEDALLGTFVFPGLGFGLSDTTHWYQEPGSQSSVTASAGTDRITWAAHGLSNAMPVVFGGTAVPGGLTAGLVYYVRNKTVNDFQVSRTRCGDIIDLLSAGTAVTASANSYYEVPHYYTVDELDRVTTVQSNDVMTIASVFRPAAELRHYGDLDWRLVDVQVGALIGPPKNVRGTPVPGKGMKVTNASAATPSVLTTSTPHQFAKGETVYVTGLGAAGIPDGLYRVHDGTAAGTTSLTLCNFADGTAVGSAGAAGLDARVYSSDGSADNTNDYVVTAVDQRNVESDASTPITITNNLFVEGAKNVLQWSPVIGAIRYRVYKKVLNSFGLIGEVQTNIGEPPSPFADFPTITLTFTDRSIAPDASKLAPNMDRTLLRTLEVTFNITANDVRVTGHKIPEGAPVVFDVVGTLPAPLEVGTTYFALNVSENAFQLAATIGSTTPIDLTSGLSGIAYAKVGNFPAAVSYIEGRRAFGGSLLNGQLVVMSSSGTEDDFSFALPEIDSDRINFTMTVRRSSQIRHMVPLSHMLLLTNNNEVRITPINDDALTPTSVSVRPQAYIGAWFAQPEIVNNNVVFVAARGKRVREMGYSVDSNGYSAGDLCHRSAHLFDGFSISQMAYGKAPTSLLWFVSSGPRMLGLTYVPEEGIGAWHQHTTAGVIESVATIPEGDEDRLYVEVLRTLNGVPTRTVERLGALREITDAADSFFVDCGLNYAGVGQTTFGGFDHLENMAIVGTANGVKFAQTVVGGALTFPSTITKLSGGLAYTSELETMPMTLNMPALSGGSPKNVNAIWARLLNSTRFSSGPVGKTPTLSPVLAPGTLFEGQEKVSVPATWSPDGRLLIRHEDPLPFHLIGLVVETAVGG